MSDETFRTTDDVASGLAHDLAPDEIILPSEGPNGEVIEWNDPPTEWADIKTYDPGATHEECEWQQRTFVASNMPTMVITQQRKNPDYVKPSS